MALTDAERLSLENQERIIKLLEEIRDIFQNGIWQCGCSHYNGSNLAVCANCGRAPGDRR